MTGKVGFVAGIVLVAVAMGVQPAAAQEGDLYDCSDFTYQEDAQTAFDANFNDPYGLDGAPGPAYSGEPNVACESLPHRPDLGGTTIEAVSSTGFNPARTGASLGATGTPGAASTPGASTSTEMANTGSETLPLALGGLAVLFGGIFFLGEEARLRARQRLASVWHNGWTTDR